MTHDSLRYINILTYLLYTVTLLTQSNTSHYYKDIQLLSWFYRNHSQSDGNLIWQHVYFTHKLAHSSLPRRRWSRALLPHQPTLKGKCSKSLARSERRLVLFSTSLSGMQLKQCILLRGGVRFIARTYCQSQKILNVMPKAAPAECNWKCYAYIVPRTRTKFGDRAFSVAGPTVWNSLPESVRSAETLASFKHKLKTCLFHISFQLAFIIY